MMPPEEPLCYPVKRQSTWGCAKVWRAPSTWPTPWRLC